jgi:hypothetical protein
MLTDEEALDEGSRRLAWSHETNGVSDFALNCHPFEIGSPLVAEVHDRLGDVALTNRHWKKAEEAFGVSAEQFAKADDSERSAQAREKAQKARAKGIKAPTAVAS